MIQLRRPESAPPKLTPEQVAALTPRSNKYLDHVNAKFGYPHPKQALAMLLPQKEVLFGGAAGGGKSDWLLRCALQYADVRQYNAIIFRRSYSSLIGLDGLVPRSQMWLADTDARWSADERTWYFPSGAALKFGYLDGPKDKYNYNSTAYSFIGFEELTEWPTDIDYRYMFSRLRKAKTVNVKPRVRSTTNPIGPGFEWVKERFVPEDENGIPIPVNNTQRYFLPSSLEDNPSIDAAEYDEALQELDAITYEKLRRGSWQSLSRGQLFPAEEVRLIARGDLPDFSKEKVAIVRYWDLAGTKPDTTNKNPDWTVGVKMARVGDKKTGYRYYILDVIELRDAFDVVFAKIQSTAAMDGRHVYIRTEQDPGQAGKGQIQTIATRLHGYDYAGFLAKGAKVVRASGLSSAWRAGSVSILSAPWNRGFINYLDQFPVPGVKDDHVDAATGAYIFLQGARDKRVPSSASGTERQRVAFDTEQYFRNQPGNSVRQWGPRPG